MLAATLVTLTAAAPASAAMGVRLAASTTSPQVGHAVSIWLFPYWPYADGSEEPAAVPDYPFRLQALGPGGRNVVFRATPTQNPYVWRGRFRFPRSGRWEIRCANYYSSQRDARLAIGYSRGGPALRVTVRP